LRPPLFSLPLESKSLHRCLNPPKPCFSFSSCAFHHPHVLSIPYPRLIPPFSRPLDSSWPVSNSPIFSPQIMKFFRPAQAFHSLIFSWVSTIVLIIFFLLIRRYATLSPVPRFFHDFLLPEGFGPRGGSGNRSLPFPVIPSPTTVFFYTIGPCSAANQTK